jgi:peptide/nickel transport system substrate-binding protein
MHTSTAPGLVARIGALALGLAALALGPVGHAGTADAQTAPKRGGTVTIAQAAHPPSLDDHATNALSAKHATFHMYEGLLTRGETGAVVPGLAEAYRVSPDGLTYTFTLRRGITFHNGKPLTSADVRASFERYKRVSARRAILNPVTAIDTPDPHTIVLRLSAVQPLFPESLSQQIVPLSIYPAEDRDTEAHKNSRVGTGPYKLVEWIADRHIVLERFAGYATNTRAQGTDGYGGRKEPFLDRIVIRFIPEPGAMVAAIEAGEIHVAETVPNRSAATLERNRQLRVLRIAPAMQHMVYVNPTKPPFDKLEVRRAVQIALDVKEIMSIAHDDNYTLNPGLMWPGRPSYTDAGKEYYNVNDRARARELLQKAGYTGEEIVMATSSDYQWMVDGATVMAEQLRSIGMKVRVVVGDWPSHVKLRGQKDGWHFSHSGKFFNQWIDSPVAYLAEYVGDKPSHFYTDPVLQGLVKEMTTLPTFEQRKAAFEKAQRRFFEQVHALTLGDRGQTQVIRAQLQGFRPSVTMRLWNVWLE